MTKAWYVVSVGVFCGWRGTMSNDHGERMDSSLTLCAAISFVVVAAGSIRKFSVSDMQSYALWLILLSSLVELNTKMWR